MSDEELLLKGICPMCHGPLPAAWTREGIQEAKEDIGMSADDDFSDVCVKCLKDHLGIEL